MNRITSTTVKHPTPPRHLGCLGEIFTAIALSLHYASENGTTASDEWDRARTEAAQQWRQEK